MHDLQTIVALNNQAVIKEPRNSFCNSPRRKAKAEWLKENKEEFINMFGSDYKRIIKAFNC